MAGTNILRDRLLTVQEAARVLNVHQNTLRRWCNAGLIAYYDISARGDRRISMRELKRFLKSHRHGSAGGSRVPD